MPAIIDTHCHVDTSSQALCESRLDVLEEAMEKSGIAAAVVMPFAWIGFNPILELKTLVNCVSKHPRLKPMLCYDKTTGVDCKQIISELLEHDNVAGVKFFTGYDSYSPLDDQIASILDHIEKKGKVAKFHTGAAARTERSLLRYCSNPHDFDELAVTRPNLKIDCAHFMAPNHIVMAPVLDKNHNVFADLSGLIDQFDKDRDNSYAGFVRYRLADALAYLPDTNQLMFGSDFPFCDPKEMVAFVESFFDEYGFTDEHKNRIWRESAAELYGFTGI
jgi:predicted TIM-barrel fold metal-dependent hydrolase